ncbi:2-hydroxyacyl-CoA dehydratase family protein [Plastorhodobacter daqingensis]|uniref:2-hydroxyacyl-CoA dehydratase family protein n=1 Tax=Plastorhodobacter daqingensis TaxID=1387281 RepID=A0ABW2UJT4_9RHOB
MTAASEEAAAALEAAFNSRDEGCSADMPRVGLFGNGIPEVVVAAAGACPVHLSMGRRALPHAIEQVIEPFVDAEARIFLNRLMQGDFAGYAGILFARDDIAALTAYQYAAEWIRQGQGAAGVPPLFLWNFVHTASEAAQAFNRIQLEKLTDFLQGQGLAQPQHGWARAAGHEKSRRQALQRLEAWQGRGQGGATAMQWRNAGRFMPAERHAELLEKALAAAGAPRGGRRLGLVGSPLACVETYRAFESLGPIVCDLQPWGSVWPGDPAAVSEPASLLQALASDAASARIVPASAHRGALLRALETRRCDLVICQISQTDDSFGWEIPSLEAELRARGIGFVNLGFRDPEPDEAWRIAAAARLAGAGVPA